MKPIALDSKPEEPLPHDSRACAGRLDSATTISVSCSTFMHRVSSEHLNESVDAITCTTPDFASVDQCNQQYSIYALTDSSGNVSERYAYTAYGQPTFLNASATVQTSSAAGNRYTYTSREWDQTIGLSHFRARWMSGVAGRFICRDPIGYWSGRSLYRSYFSVRGELDPSGLRVVVGIGPNGPIHKYESGDAPPVPPFGNACFTLSQYGPIWEPCPMMPPDDPEGPSYLQGLKSIFNSLTALERACDTCCGGNCKPMDCKRDMRRLRDELLRAWQDHYGRGPATPHNGQPNPHRDPVAGYYCWDWARIFRDAVNSVGSSCFTARLDAGQDKSVPDPDTGKFKSHWWARLTFTSSACKIAIDDGFLVEGDELVHTDEFPPADNRYIPTTNPNPYPEYPFIPPNPPYPEPIPRLKILK